MRTRGLAVAVIGAGLCVAALGAQDALTALGGRPADAQAALFQVLGEGRLYHNAAKEAFLKAATAEARVALVNGAMTWAKAFTESPEFARQYATRRAGEEPRLPWDRKYTVEEELTRQQSLLDQRLVAERKELDAPPAPRQTPEQQQRARRFTEQRIKNMEAERARYTDPTWRAMLRKPLEAAAQRYQEERVQWEQDYPADYRVAVARRLREFLALSATVDFGAKLVPCKDSWERHSCFANAAYEKKPDEWKRCYRAGRQPVEAARLFATNWLRDLEKK